MERGLGSQVLSPHCPLPSPKCPVIFPVSRSLHIPPLTITVSQEKVDPSISASAGQLRRWGSGLNPTSGSVHGLIKGVSPQPTPSLTCTTSLAPAASAKVIPPQSRTTTRTGSATRTGEGKSTQMLPWVMPKSPSLASHLTCVRWAICLWSLLWVGKGSHHL